MHHQWTVHQPCPFQANSGKAVEAVRQVGKSSKTLLGMVLVAWEREAPGMSAKRRPADPEISNVGPNKECLLQQSEERPDRDSPLSSAICYSGYTRDLAD